MSGEINPIFVFRSYILFLLMVTVNLFIVFFMGFLILYRIFYLIFIFTSHSPQHLLPEPLIFNKVIPSIFIILIIFLRSHSSH